jgi:hypothetical protein
MLSYSFTLRLLKTLQAFDLPKLLNWNVNSSYAVVAGDNCAYFYHSSQHRVDSPSHLLHTINWIEVFPEIQATVTSKWTEMNQDDHISSTCNWIALSDTQRFKDIDEWWKQINSWTARRRHLLDHSPSTVFRLRTQFAIQPPILNCNTAAKDDMDRFVQTLYWKYILQEKKNVVVVFGDEQLVSALYSRIFKSTDEYCWMLPFPAEGHLLMHFTMAMYDVFGTLLLSLSEKLGWSTLSSKFNLKDWIKHEDFLIITMEATTRWIHQIFGKLEQPEKILQSTIWNARLHSWLTFYFQYGLMYWKLRQAIRTEDCEIVNLAWKWCTTLFLAANKPHYARLCVIATHILYHANSELGAVLNSRFLSLSSKLGHSVAIDIGVEKVNRTAKQSITHATESRIDSFLSFMTLSKEVTSQFLDGICLEISGDRRPVEYEHEISNIISLFNATFGDSNWTVGQPSIFKDFHDNHQFQVSTPEKRLQQAKAKLPKLLKRTSKGLYALTYQDDLLEGSIPTEPLTTFDEVE